MCVLLAKRMFFLLLLSCFYTMVTTKHEKNIIIQFKSIYMICLLYFLHFIIIASHTQTHTHASDVIHGSRSSLFFTYKQSWFSTNVTYCLKWLIFKIACRHIFRTTSTPTSTDCVHFSRLDSWQKTTRNCFRLFSHAFDHVFVWCKGRCCVYAM